MLKCCMIQVILATKLLNIMIKAIIVDEDKSSIEQIQSLLHKFFLNKILVVDKCHTVSDALDSVKHNSPDLLFMDVKIQKLTAFDLLKQLDMRVLEVIFITEHEDLAIEAIKYDALDYILKPLNAVTFLSAVKRYLKKVSSLKYVDKIKLLLENIEIGNSEGLRVHFPTETGYRVINVHAIIQCQADINYCIIHLANDTSFIISKTLKYVEGILPSGLFLRCHKSHLVNRNYIKEYNKNDGGYLVLSNNVRVPVSNRKRNDVKHNILLGISDF